MVWGAAASGIDDLVRRVAANDAALASLHIMRFRRFGHQVIQCAMINMTPKCWAVVQIVCDCRRAAQRKQCSTTVLHRCAIPCACWLNLFLYQVIIQKRPHLLSTERQPSVWLLGCCLPCCFTTMDRILS